MSEPGVKSKKIMSLIAAGPNSDRAAFRDRFLHRHAQHVLWHCPHVTRYIVNLVDVKAKVVFRGKTTPPHREIDPPPFEVVTEMWFDSFDDFKDPARLYDTPAGRELIQDELAEMGARRYDYLVSPVVQWDRNRPRSLASAARESRRCSFHAGTRTLTSRRRKRPGASIESRPISITPTRRVTCKTA